MFAKRKSGFTLIELLVVIAIIAILAAILFPVFARAREAARKAKCLNNLKQCAQALKMYADDYDGTMPSSGIAYTTPNATNMADFCAKACNAGTYPPTGTATTPAIRVSWPQYLYDHMKSQDIVFCPSDSVTPPFNAATICSYWYKYANDLAWNTLTLRKQKMGDYGYESDQVAFFEYKGWHFGDQTGVKKGIQFNMSYVDTHVETVVLPDDTSSPATPITNTNYTAMATVASPFYYNTTVNATTQSATRMVPIATNAAGQGIDPSANYDSF